MDERQRRASPGGASPAAAAAADDAGVGSSARLGEDGPTVVKRWVPRARAVVADRFRLVAPLGRGAMGVVWRADHLGLEVPCAVKFLEGNGAGSPGSRALSRFKLEAKAAAQIRSPHVVQILDYGVWSGAPYIAMELLEGEDLAQRLRRRGRLPVAEVVKLVNELARALTKAHAAGVVHRDLKPANIFLVRDAEGEVTKVVDFGIAKDAQRILSTTTTGALVGTPCYMSPEQLRGGAQIDAHADLWALGVVTYQCLTGALPFPAPNLADLVVRILVDPRPVPSRDHAAHDLPSGFDGWWARASATDRAHRFASAREMADALAKALAVPAPGAPLNSMVADATTSHGMSRTLDRPAPQPAPEPRPKLDALRVSRDPSLPATEKLGPDPPSTAELERVRPIATPPDLDARLVRAEPRRPRVLPQLARELIAAVGLALLLIAGVLGVRRALETREDVAVVADTKPTADAPSGFPQAPQSPAAAPSSAHAVDPPSETGTAAPSSPDAAPAPARPAGPDNRRREKVPRKLATETGRAPSDKAPRIVSPGF